MKPLTVERLGLGYVLRMPDVAAEIAVGRLTGSRDGLRGRLRVMCAMPDSPSADGSLYHGDFNLSSPTTRTALSRYLDRRYDGIKWSSVLETFCDAVLTMEGAGEPFETVGRAPRRQIRDYVLRPLIPAGQSTVIFGAGGSGKTTLAAVFGCSVHTGIRLVNGFEPTRGNVMVLDWERSRDDWNDLVSAISDGADIDPPELIYRFCAGRTLADQVEEIARKVMAENVRLLIIDSAAHASGFGRDGGDPSEATAKLHSALRVIKTAALIVDHIAGENLENERSVSKPYGSVYKLNSPQGGVFELRREKSVGAVPGHLALIDTKRNLRATLPPVGLRIEYEGDDPATSIRVLREEIHTPALTRAALSLADRIERALKEAMVALEPKEIATAVGLDATATNDVQQVRNALNQFKGRRFTRLSDGRWGLAAHVA